MWFIPPFKCFFRCMEMANLTMLKTAVNIMFDPREPPVLGHISSGISSRTCGLQNSSKSLCLFPPSPPLLVIPLSLFSVSYTRCIFIHRFSLSLFSANLLGVSLFNNSLFLFSLLIYSVYLYSTILSFSFLCKLYSVYLYSTILSFSFSANFLVVSLFDNSLFVFSL